MNFKQLAKALNREFGPPYLPEGFARFFGGDDEMTVIIDGRDVTVDKSGKVTGSGTALNSRFEVREYTQEEIEERPNRVVVEEDQER